MKTKYIILLGLIAICFSACNLTGSVNNTPQILFVTNPICNKTDTLDKYYTDVSSVYRLDTIQVGDTVSFRMLLYGYSNNLTAYNLQVSDTTVAKVLLPTSTSLDSIFSGTSSDYSSGKFVFKNKTTSVYFPFKYVAKKASTAVSITFALSSDASFEGSSMGSNTFYFILKTPIVLPKESSKKK